MQHMVLRVLPSLVFSPLLLSAIARLAVSTLLSVFSGGCFGLVRRYGLVLPDHSPIFPLRPFQIASSGCSILELLVLFLPFRHPTINQTSFFFYPTIVNWQLDQTKKTQRSPAGDRTRVFRLPVGRSNHKKEVWLDGMVPTGTNFDMIPPLSYFHTGLRFLPFLPCVRHHDFQRFFLQYVDVAFSVPWASDGVLYRKG